MALLNSPHPHKVVHRCQAHLARSTHSEGSHCLHVVDKNPAPRAAVLDVVLVVRGGRGSTALVALDDLDRLEHLVVATSTSCACPPPGEGAPPMTRTQPRESTTSALHKSRA